MIKQPYPYFGGKAAVASEVWRRLGDVPLYIEPFLGGGSVWLARPNVRHALHQWTDINSPPDLTNLSIVANPSAS